MQRFIEIAIAGTKLRRLVPIDRVQVVDENRKGGAVVTVLTLDGRNVNYATAESYIKLRNRLARPDPVIRMSVSKSLRGSN